MHKTVPIQLRSSIKQEQKHCELNSLTLTVFLALNLNLIKSEHQDKTAVTLWTKLPLQPRPHTQDLSTSLDLASMKDYGNNTLAPIIFI